MPGIENFAPDRTLTSSGSSGSPSALPDLALELGQRGVDLPPSAAGSSPCSR